MRVDFRLTVLLTGLSFIPCIVTAQQDDSKPVIPAIKILSNESGFPERLEYHGPAAFFRESNDPSGDYCRIILPGHHFTPVVGEPELPVFSRLIEVPEGMTISVSISEVCSAELSLSDNRMKGRQIYPAQPGRTKNMEPDEKVVFKDKKLYRTKGPIIHDTVKISRVGRFRGKELMNIAVYPAFYNPAAEKINLITSMKIDIRYEPSDSKGVSSTISFDSKSGKNPEDYITGYSDKPVGMVIITDSIFIKTLQPFVIWKMQKGINVTTIVSNGDTPDEEYAYLKDTLMAMYRSGLEEDNPPQYLLIVGDPAIIPTATNTSNISDLYYGEFDGNEDYIPELYTGRMPVSDTTELKNVVRKIIDYEKYNYSEDNDFWSGALATAGNDPEYAPIMNGQVNYISNNYYDQDPTIEGYKWLYPSSTTKRDSLLLLVNSGLGILNYTGHGSYLGFNSPEFKVADLASVSNINKYPLIIANACLTAQINAMSCFATEIFCAPDKGAIGYVGCTNNSFWSEDFYWAVGLGTPGLDATYENTGLGVFDRLFHSHGEEPGDWIYTLGQINFAGNLAVSASTSLRKKYYWETYILVGDPSLMPYIGKPDTFNIEVSDTLPQVLTDLCFTTKPFAYAALSDFDTLSDAKFATPSGYVSLKIPDGLKDSCLLVVTGQNMVPFIKTLYFGLVNDEYLTVGNIEYDDSEGNDNKSPDYSERINLKFTISNLGLQDATNLTATLSVISGSIDIEQGTVSPGTISGGGSYSVNNQVFFNVSDEAPDDELASLLLTITSDRHTYQFIIDMTLLAPAIEIVSSIPDDIITGNANYLPDPGEDIIINVRIANAGSSSTNGTVRINENTPLLSVPLNIVPTGDLYPGSEKVVSFNASISGLAQSGDILPFDVILDCGSYNATGTYSICAGKTRETWEHSRFDVFPWIQPAENPWYVTSASAYENVMAVRSATIEDNNESTLSILLNNPERDTISFYSRISSEEKFDEFIFMIDGKEEISISGELPWTEREAVVKPGVHYLEWIYRKDYSQSVGSDAVWIDLITFPDIAFLETDIKIDTVFAPPDTALINDVTITGRVINFGRTPLTGIPLAYRINDGELVQETFNVTVEPGDSVDIAFSNHCAFTPDNYYTIAIINRLTNDGYAGNDIALNSFTAEGEDNYGALFVYPSPFREEVTIIYKALSTGTVTIDIIDMMGNMVYKRSVPVIEGANKVDISCKEKFARGVYTVRVREGNFYHSRKIVKAQ